MDDERASAAMVGGVAVLERAIAYALGSLAEVTPEALGRRTPCRLWNVRDLLDHLYDSMTALQEAAEIGTVAPPPGASPPPAAFPSPADSLSPAAPPTSVARRTPADSRTSAGFRTPAGSRTTSDSPSPAGPSPPAASSSPAADVVVSRVRDRAISLLGAWASADRSIAVCIAGAPITAPIVAGAGAIEVAVHGWDLAQACGPQRPIPAGLADELLGLSVLFVRGGDRPGRFALPVAVPANAPPGDRLVAFLGRRPS
jgi:uncharacterized protein (TIGR03086 family)